MYHTHVHQPHTHSIPDTGVLGDSNDNKDFRSGGGGICEEQEVTWLRRRVQKLELQAADDAREGGREERKRGSETEGGQEGGSVWEEDIYIYIYIYVCIHTYTHTRTHTHTHTNCYIHTHIPDTSGAVAA